MKERWKKGKPPAPGWYHASLYFSKNVFRWWDGKNWSFGVCKDDDIHEVARSAAEPFPLYPDDIMYWREIKL